MSVFIAHAPADRAAAEALETFLERRGQFVEMDDGETALRPVTPRDALVLLVSKDLVFAPMRLRLEQRALDAWADGRLIVVKLDHGIAPVGLRDLAAIDASVEAQREFKWQEVADAIRCLLQAGRQEDDETLAQAPAAPKRQRTRMSGLWRVLLCVLLMLPGLAALAIAGSIWLANRIGPTPGTFADLIAGIDAFGVDRGLPHGLTLGLFAFAVALMVLAPLALIARTLLRRAPSAPPAETAPAAPDGQERQAVFVSYARANAQAVLPVIEAAKQQGHAFWLDQQGIGAGNGWAGEIVRAIRNAAGVIVMCSKSAFESDHVKREVYLADRYRRKLIPVFIEDAEPPEDFEYFFAGVQHLKLFETPEPERPNALAQLLGTPA